MKKQGENKKAAGFKSAASAEIWEEIDYFTPAPDIRQRATHAGRGGTRLSGRTGNWLKSWPHFGGILCGASSALGADAKQADCHQASVK
jgi:hypothetical protein